MKKKVLIVILLLHPLILLSLDYYWIDGSGYWSDINHWATSSGGTILHSQVPTSDDDVYFDNNSFNSTGQVISVNAENAVCRNLDWTGALHAPEFKSTNSINLRIFGSLIVIQNMIYNYSGTISFESTSAGNIIMLEGHQLQNNVFFEGLGGQWTLMDEFSVQGKIYLNTGTLITNDQTVNCVGFYSLQNDPRSIELGNSILTVSNTWSLGGSNLTFNAGNSVIHVGELLTNSDNSNLVYNSVRLSGFNSNVKNVSAQVVYDSIVFQYNGDLTGDCNVDYLFFTISGSVNGTDTIRYVEFGDCGNNRITGNSNIDTAIFKCDGVIEGCNQIEFASFIGRSQILENNQIGYCLAGDTAIIRNSNSFGYLYLSRIGYLRGQNFGSYVHFNCDGDIQGNNVFDTLVFSPGFEYLFQHGSIQTINKDIVLNGTCEDRIFLKSDYIGLQATLNKTEGDVMGSFLSVRDIQASGNVSFIADQSVDLGNNTNWLFDLVQPRSLFWVNGCGGWNESFHWDTIDGGPGGCCPPTELDNVFFDINSFNFSTDSVIINTRNAVCNDMEWSTSGSQKLAGPDTNNLKIYGSLFFSENMNFPFRGETHFENVTGGQHIESKGKFFNNNVRFQGPGGGWLLKDRFCCIDTIYLIYGELGTYGNNIESMYFFSSDTNERKLFLHSDTVKLSGFSTTWFINAQNLDLHADSSVIVTTGPGSQVVNTNGYGLIYNNIHQGGLSARILNFAYCEFNLITHAGLGSEIIGDCKIDTAIFYSDFGQILNKDTIKTVIYFGADGLLDGAHVVEIAYFYNSGIVNGGNKIDTALFYLTGLIKGNNFIDTTIVMKKAVFEGQNTIRTATLRDNGDFYGNNTFSDLSLRFAKKYQFEHDSTQTIKDNLVANGRCTGNIILMSDVDGEQAILKKVSNGVDIEYAILRDLKAAGGGLPFIANSSIDLGNNSNWEINSPESLALYWVDGSGNWSDSLHWAPVSGGQGGYCIPTPIDDVYFDENSFTGLGQSVNLDIENATCRNMSWMGSETANPYFTGPEPNNLLIYGSLIFNDSLNLDYNGVTYFESTETGKLIETHDRAFNNNVVLRGRGGGWCLSDNLFTPEDFILVAGSLNTNDMELKCKNFISSDTSSRQIILESSDIHVDSVWKINATNLVFDGSESTIFAKCLLQSDTGSALIYNDVVLTGTATVKNNSVYCYFNNMLFQSIGTISGDCYIDSLVFTGSGIVNDSDSINYAYFKSSGTINGGYHKIRTLLFDGNGTVTGNNSVMSAIFYSNGNITGNNNIDTTIIYGNGVIQGDNVFNSNVVIFGNGSIVGNNIIEKFLVIHGVAYIFSNNHIYDALLLDWGNIGGANIFNNLTFTPGNTYTLTSETTQYILDEFSIRGNNCFPITLQSSTQNIQALIDKPENIVSGDFIYMRDIKATGGASFYSGGHSDNISNNSGWLWDNAPDYIYGLRNDTTICEGDTLVLSTENFNAGPGTIVLWNDGTTSPEYSVVDSGMYKVLVKYSEDCMVPDSVHVGMYPKPEVGLGDDLVICEGEVAQLLPDEYFENYYWQNGSTESFIYASLPGVYWVEVTDLNGCKNRDSLDVSVISVPDVFLGNDTIIHKDEFVILNAGNAGSQYLWSTGDTVQIIEAEGKDEGAEYWVVVENAGCKAADTVIIFEQNCAVGIPTAFTPNGDGANDVLFVRGPGIIQLEFMVFDRYGELVFETNDQSIGWDGTRNGEKQEEDVYIYYLNAICFDGALIERTGSITLIR